ncbi:hypothetical protein JKA74_13985 [Marivirga sp. S37H4]|uniref:Uncharacterized protein n=1 Tax=Marivirga aurantiaca TaxID=2802615 RepID=A0A934X0J6_9BACT|nr:hypothetical protein [Marivirga aurantiaca]MBK6266150.1 hypothetical protein [Marivirga aurantiaca]
MEAKAIVENHIDKNQKKITTPIEGQFKYPEESRLVYANLLMRGYSKNEIKFALPPKMPVEYVETRDKEGIVFKRLKLGGIFGAAVSVAIVILYMVLSGGLFNEGSWLIALIGIGVGIVWGALLGLLLGPLLPVSSAIRIKSKDQLSKATIRFMPRNRIDALYFKNKWHFQMD